MQSKLEELEIEPKNANLERIPETYVSLSTSDAEQALKLIDALEDNDDVQNVFHNIEMTDSIAAMMN
jgi:transcriptional/translational regulatory protein YebC/TACO1